jgi:hemolysin III
MQSATSTTAFHGQRFNIAGHLLGLALAACFAVQLAGRCSPACDPAAVTGVAIFTATGMLLFAASVLCHATHGRWHARWQRLDHAATFLLIAGSYAPFATAPPRQSLALPVLALLWAAALALAARELLQQPSRPPSLRAYVALGWASVMAAIPAALATGPVALALLLAGAACYSLGTVFYRNASGWPHAHGVWHLLVVAGATSHAAAIASLPLR